MRENRTYGLEGGEVILPDPYQCDDTSMTNAVTLLNSYAIFLRPDLKINKPSSQCVIRPRG